MRHRNRLGLVAGLVLGFALGHEAMGQDVPVASIPTCEELAAGCQLTAIRQWQAANELCAALEAPDENGEVTQEQRLWAQGCRDRAAITWAEAQRQCGAFLFVCMEVREWFIPFRQLLPIDIMFAFEEWNPQPYGPGPFGGPIGGQPKDEPIGPFLGDETSDHGYLQPAVHPRKAPR